MTGLSRSKPLAIAWWVAKRHQCRWVGSKKSKMQLNKSYVHYSMKLRRFFSLVYGPEKGQYVWNLFPFVSHIQWHSPTGSVLNWVVLLKVICVGLAKRPLKGALGYVF